MNRIAILAATLVTAAGGASMAQEPDKGLDIDRIVDSGRARSETTVRVAEGGPKPSADGVADVTAKVDISCDNATIMDIVTQFRRATRANIICAESPNLERRVSVTLVGVPWFEAFRSILNSRGFLVETRDGVYYVKEEVITVPVRTRSYVLNHADAKELAANLNEIYAPRLPDSKDIERPIAKAYPSANTLIVTAEDELLADCEKIIQRVDRPVPQVYIEARFIELSNQALHKLGMKWDALMEWGASVRNVSGGIEVNGGKVKDYGLYQTDGTMSQNETLSTSTDAEGKASVSLSDSSQNQSTLTGLVPDSIEDAISAGRQAASLGWANASGFGGQITVDNLRLALSAFESMSDAKVFSNPKIIVSNGKEAKVDMTTKFPNVRASSHRNTNNGSDSLDITTELEVIPGSDPLDFAGKIFFEWGITLSVLPRISPDGLISVRIVPTISNQKDFYTIEGGEDSSASAYTKYPIIDMQRLITDFTMKDGSTAVIGGLSRTVEEDVDTGIPYLRRIPWIGQRLFGWTSRQKVQKEIIVFVTVGIANPESLDRGIGLPKNAILGREFVEGRQQEPGDRALARAPDGALIAPLSLDLTPIDRRDHGQYNYLEPERAEAGVATVAIRTDEPPAAEPPPEIPVTVVSPMPLVVTDSLVKPVPPPERMAGQQLPAVKSRNDDVTIDDLLR